MLFTKDAFLLTSAIVNQKVSYCNDRDFDYCVIPSRIGRVS
jgi:hypothetical protein